MVRKRWGRWHGPTFAFVAVCVPDCNPERHGLNRQARTMAGPALNVCIVVAGSRSSIQEV